MTTEEFKRDYPQCSHLEGDDLWDAMTEAMLASDIEFEVPLEKPKGPTETYSMIILDMSDKVNRFKSLQDFYKDEMLKSTGVPSKYFGGIDPYKESNSVDEVHISEEVGGFWQRIVDKIMKK